MSGPIFGVLARAIVTGAVMFGEQVDARVIGGTGLILGGVTVVNSRFGRRRIFGRRAPEPSADATTEAVA